MRGLKKVTGSEQKRKKKFHPKKKLRQNKKLWSVSTSVFYFHEVFLTTREKDMIKF